MIITLYTFYLIVGAIILSAIEGPKEQDKMKILRELRRQFMQKVEECVSGLLKAEAKSKFSKIATFCFKLRKRSDICKIDQAFCANMLRCGHGRPQKFFQRGAKPPTL